MSVFKCKMCGGTIEFEQGATVGVCDSCGTKQTLPTANDEIIANLHNRATTLRLKCEFDKAEEIYNKILVNNPNDAEAHWGIILCKYGIEYVEDPKTYKRVPTCHRTSFEAILADEDYKAAIANGDAAQRELYEAEAKEIDRIQKDILAIVKNEKPFDVFICYKETDENGKRSQDSVIANDIYYQLTQEGFKVFYAAITLEDKLGQEYEPYIFAALNSSKVMLVVGSKAEYFNAVWVKNEWSRFLKLMKTDRSKLLIPCYRDIDAYELPEEFAHLQAQDMSKIGFINDLVRGIKKVAADSAAENTVKETVVVNSGNSNVAPLLKRAFMFLEDRDWDSADEYCEKVLDQDPENAEAYLGKLMAELQVCKKEDLKNCDTPFDDSNNYQKAVRFGNNDLPKYIAHINERINERSEAYKIRIDNIAKAIFNHYNQSSYKNREEHLRDSILYLENVASELPAIIEKISLGKETLRNLESRKRTLSVERASLGIFKMKEKKNIDAELAEIQKKINQSEKEIFELESKVNEYKTVDNIRSMIESKRRELDKTISDANLYTDTAISFEDAKKEMKSDETLKKDVLALYPTLQMKIAEVGDLVKFGKYRQKSNGNDRMPIEWLVLAKENNKILVVSDKALDCQRYNTSFTEVTWESCSLRKWMNGTFLNNAFSAEEQALIQSTTLSADKNPKYNTNPGNATTDKVFLLSITEAGKYFSTDESRKCAPTAYAKAQGAYTSDSNKTASGEAACWWWLRSPGNYQNIAAGVNRGGSVYYLGSIVSNDNFCVRPALWINLDS